MALYVFAAFCLLLLAFVNQRNYQDAWILDGVLLPTLSFVLIFSIVASKLNDNRILALICASFLSILSSIPQLKYQFIYGVFDSIAHYGFINRLLFLGHVPEIGFYAKEYSGTPGMHIFIGSLSLVAGISTNTAIKLVLSIIPTIIPLLIYFVTKGVVNKNMQRFVLYASSFSVPILYYLSGSTFALAMYTLFLSLLLRRIFTSSNRREYSLSLTILAFGLIISHGITSIFLSLLIAGASIILKTLEFTKRIKGSTVSSNYFFTSLMFTVSFLAWWIYQARFYFYEFLGRMFKLLIGGEIVKVIPSKFFELSLLDQLKIFIVRFSSYTIILTLSIIGLLFFLIAFKQRSKDRLKDLYLHSLSCLTVILLLIAFSAFKYPTYTYDRYVIYALFFSPFFVGLALWRLSEYIDFYVKKIMFQKFIFALILYTFISLSLIQLFPCQPLVPKIYNEYVVDYRGVNTIYQKEMILFAEKFSKSGVRIASDTVTSWQIFGLTNVSFNSGYVWCNPLLDKEVEADLILLHYSGKSGPLNEEVDYRTRARINELRLELGNVIYDNGESFVMLRVSI